MPATPASEDSSKSLEAILSAYLHTISQSFHADACFPGTTLEYIGHRDLEIRALGCRRVIEGLRCRQF